MGARKKRQALTLKPTAEAVAEALDWLEMPAGRLQARWNQEAALTPFGQMAYFIEFLT